MKFEVGDKVRSRITDALGVVTQTRDDAFVTELQRNNVEVTFGEDSGYEWFRGAVWVPESELELIKEGE